MLLICKPVFDGEILSLDPSKLAQLLQERLHKDRDTGSSAPIQETYAEDFPGLLRVTWIEQNANDRIEEEDFFSRIFSGGGGGKYGK